MQMNFDSASVASRSIVMPAPTSVPMGDSARRRDLVQGPTHPLSKARLEALRSNASENMVWLAVGLCAVGALAVSLFS